VNVAEKEIKPLLEKFKKLVVYGLSPDSSKASHYVPLYLRGQGWDIVGVYPKIHSEGGFKIYSSLKEVPSEYLQFVNVFRSSDRIPEVVDEVLSLNKTNFLWLQLGISNSEAEQRAENHGIKVVSNHCLIIEHKKWFT